ISEKKTEKKTGLKKGDRKMEIFNLRRAESFVEEIRKEAELRKALENSVCCIHQSEASSAAA
ncbi:MAG TPA: hypothetical protein O0X42_05560, partial [Methanocorpusculum sp.]|nr:hypothetical protein [Methanocorpusculum sp.]